MKFPKDIEDFCKKYGLNKNENIFDLIRAAKKAETRYERDLDLSYESYLEDVAGGRFDGVIKSKGQYETDCYEQDFGSSDAENASGLLCVIQGLDEQKR